MKMFIDELVRLDHDMTVLSLSKQKSFAPKTDNFPKDEAKFKELFLIHLQSCKTAHLMVIGCILHTTKTINELKSSDDPNTSLLPWLCAHQIYVTADSLSHHVTRTLGHLVHIHPQVTCQSTLQETLFDALQKFPLTKKR